MKLSWVISALLLTILGAKVFAEKAGDPDRKRTVTLIVFKDDSDSMLNHLRQVRQLSDRLVTALQRTNCMELNLAVAAQSRFELRQGDSLVHGSVLEAGGESPRRIETGSDRFIRLRRANDLERFKARIVHGENLGVNEAAVAHVTDMIVKESAFLRQADAVAALVVTDVAVGSDLVHSDSVHLDRIQKALGSTPFIAFGLGMNSAAEKVRCLPDFPLACFENMTARLSGHVPNENPDMAPVASGIDGETAFFMMQESGVTYSSLARACSDRYSLAAPDLLEKFTLKSGGKFADICAPKSIELADQMAEAILKAAKCQFLM